jgi:excisionase family DNA binding protein
MNAQPTPKYLHTESAAAYLGLSKSTLEKHRINGNGPAFRKLGRRVLYAIGDLDAWADNCRRQSTSEIAA